MPLDFEPGEMMQVDWGDMRAFIGGVDTNVSVFVTVLPYSYAVYASVFPDKSETCVRRGACPGLQFLRGRGQTLPIRQHSQDRRRLRAPASTPSNTMNLKEAGGALWL